MSMHDFLGVNLVRTFRGDVVLIFFIPYGPMLMKTKKKNFKISKRFSGYRYMSLKFGVNPLDGFRENDVYGRTDDGRPCHNSSSAVQ